MGIEIPQNKFLILDGAIGIVLQQWGLSPQGRPGLLNLTGPELLSSVYKEYIAAGGQVIYANTFGANGLKLTKTGHSVERVVGAAIAVVEKVAADAKILVALDVGPLGELSEPMGTLSFERAYDLFREMAEVGAKAGADLIVVETIADLRGAKAALLAAKEATYLPMFVTVSFDVGGRTFAGHTVASMVHTLEDLGADAIGLNCSLGPDLLVPLLRELYENTRLPVVAKPNAGLPDPMDGHYDMGPKDFAQTLLTCVETGIFIVGGCCDTSPEYIRRLTAVLKGRKPVSRHYSNTDLVCTPVTSIRLNGVRVVGERINSTGKKRFQQALLENDLDYILDVDVQQEDAGADILGVNVGFPGVNEVVMLLRVVKKLQNTIAVPLQLDSSNSDALETGLWVCNDKAAVNSVNGEPEVLERVLPVVKKYDTSMVGLTLDKDGIPKTVEERVAITRRILQAALNHGIPREDVWIGYLTLIVSVQQEQTMKALKAMRTIRGELGLQVVLGVSNISFGLLNRKLITQNFLIQTVHAGLILSIINPNQTEMVDAMAAYRVLSGEDRECQTYVARFTAGSPAVQVAPRANALTLGDAVIYGLETDAEKLAAKALGTEDELSLVGNHLIPALDKMGEDYDEDTAFPPQLFSAVQAAQAVFEVIRSSIAAKDSVPVKKGKLIVTTMQGDIHDIGKSIVKTVLGSYGYEVLDLDRDVLPETILRTIQGQGVRLVGLSALMTTTPPTMERTIRLLHTIEEPPVIFVDGAMVMPEYAKRVNTGYYARDVRQSVEVTRKAMG